jgi:CTP:molybdopterin cytidylyltransferase MocA
VAAVVLAAGGSRRLQAPKQLLEFRGEPLVRRAARAALVAGATPVIVVLGASAAEIARALEGVPELSLTTNDGWGDGLASSIVAGVREVMRLDARADGVLITTADQPLVDEAALGRLLSAFDQRARLVAADYSGTIGVPAVIGCEHFDALLGLTGDAGAGRWLRERIDVVTRVAMPEAAVDIDTTQDSALLASLA